MIRPYVTERLLVLERIRGEKVDRRPRAAAGARRGARARLLPRLHPPGDARGRLPRRPAPRERDADRRRPDRAARLRPARPARRGDAHARSRCCCSRSRRTAPTTSPTLLLSLSVTTLDSDEPGFVHELRRKLPRYHWRPLAGIRDRRGARRPAADRASPRGRACRRRSRSSARRSRRPTRSRARSTRSSTPSQLIEREAYELVLSGGRGAARAGALLRQPVRAARHADSRLPRRVGQIADRLEAGTLKVGIVPASLDDTEHMLRSVANRRRRLDHRRRTADLVGADGARQPRRRARRLLPLRRDRPLHDLADHPDARRALADRLF